MRLWNRILVALVVGVACTGCTKGFDYLIITHDDFYASVLPLAAAKRAMGYETRVIRTSEIGVSPTANDIAGAIQNSYAFLTPKVKYVLLVGSTSHIPAHYTVAHNPTEDGMIATDLYYATMETSDYLPDICVGRLPASTVAEATTMVNKIINYTPKSTKVLFYGSTPELSYADGDRIGILTPAGYTVDTLADAAATGAQVVSRINAGRLMVAYYGHGSTTSAGNLWTAHVTPTSMTNTELPVFISGGCFNCEYDHATAISIGEELVLTPAGAVAFVGSTRTGGYGYAYTFVDGFYTELSVTGQLGPMVNAGRKAAYDAAVAAGSPVGDGSWTKSFIEKITLLGDPELNLIVSP